jgi:Holliday junction resolvasome RuvABC endonuclease subunit
MKVILGLDPSSHKTGWCFMEKDTKRIIKSGAFEISDKIPLNARLPLLHTWLSGIIKDNSEHEITIYFEKSLPTKSRTTSFVFGAVYGVICLLPIDSKLEVKPVEWRAMVYRNVDNWRITGMGRPQQKALAISEVKRRYGIEVGDDEAESILIAVYGCILES